MASVNDTLELLVKIGVIGKEQLPELRQQLNAVSGATEDLGGKEKEAAGFTELLHHNHRALHLIMHQIGAETSPALGHALAGALYGPIGIAIALGAAVHYVSEALNKASEAADKLAEKFAEGLDDRLNIHRAIVDEVRQSHAELNTAIKNAGEVEDTFANHLKNVDVFLDARNAKLKAQLELLKANELAEAKNAQERESVEKKYSALGKGLDLGTETEKVNEMRETQRKAAENEERLKQEAVAANAAAAKAEEELKVAKDTRDKAIEQLKDKSPEGIKKRMAEAEEDYNSYKKTYDEYYAAHPNAPKLPIAENALEHRRAAIEKAQHEEDQYQKLKSQADTKIGPLSEKAATAKDEAEKAKKRVEDAAKYATGPGAEALSQAEAKLKNDLEVKRLNDLIGLGVTGGRAGLDKAGGIVSAGESALDAERHGLKLNKEQEAAKQRLIALLEALGGHSREVLQGLEASKNLHAAMGSEVIIIKRAILDVEKRFALELEQVKAQANGRPL